MVEVNADDITYQDGALLAPASAIPEGITFVGNRRNVTFKNLTFNGMGNGVVVNNDQHADQIAIENCKFIDCRTPDDCAKDTLLSARGYGIFISAGKNWTIRDSAFTTKAKDASNPADRACSVQYAGRFGKVHGFHVATTRFENWVGKPCVWLMFVREALFDRVEFVGGRIWIGAAPGAMADVQKGDCRNIVFRNCKFNFGVFEDWPASIVVLPGSDAIYFVDCDVNTVEGCEWWLEIDSRDTKTVRWKNCKWNGKPVEGYTGIRTQLSQDEMKSRNIGPIEPEAAATPSASLSRR